MYEINLKVNLGGSIAQVQKLNGALMQTLGLQNRVNAATGGMPGGGGSGGSGGGGGGGGTKFSTVNVGRALASTVSSSMSSSAAMAGANNVAGLVSAGGNAVSGLIKGVSSSLAGLGPIGTAIGISLTLLGAELALLTKAVIAGTKEFMALATGAASLYYKGGGSLGQTNSLIGIGAATGFTPGQMGDMARQFNQAMISNPYLAAQMAARGVVGNYAGPMGNLNDPGRLLEGIKAILNPNISDDSARRLAYNNPLENFIQYRGASPAIQKMILEYQRNQMDPAKMQAAIDAQAIFQMAFSKLKDLMVDFGMIVLPVVLRGTIAFVKAVATLGNLYVRWMTLGQKSLMSPDEMKRLGADMKGLNDVINNIGKASNQAAHHIRGLGDAASQAANDIRGFTRERQSFGGGANTRHAVPPGAYYPNSSGAYGSQFAGIKMGQIPVG